MTITHEQEFKTLLTHEQADAIRDAYAFDPAFRQTNRYFDTPDFQLKAAGYGLRIRQFADSSEQTLKVPAGPNRALFEYTDRLPANARVLQGGGYVERELATIGVALTELVPFASMTTDRSLAHLPAGLLTLDHSHYPNHHSDWELELEYDNFSEANTFWQTLITKFKISIQAPQNKVSRAIANSRGAI